MQVQGVVEISVGTVSETLECRDIFVDAALFHAELFKIVCCSFVFSIVNEHIAKITFEDLPGCHAEGNSRFACLDLVEPLVQAVSPSFHFCAFNEG